MKTFKQFLTEGKSEIDAMKARISPKALKKTGWYEFVIDELIRATEKRQTDPELSIPQSLDQAILGLQWAMQTARVSGMVDQKIRAMNGLQVIKLIDKIASKTTTQNDVPKFLNKELG